MTLRGLWKQCFIPKKFFPNKKHLANLFSSQVFLFISGFRASLANGTPSEKIDNGQEDNRTQEGDNKP